MAIITTRPRTREMNERVIRRVQEDFDRGMMRQLDTEGTDIGPRALSDLINGRCGHRFVEGRSGSQLWTPADYGITIATTVETLSDSMQSGLLYKANNNAVPNIGDIFMTYDSGDFADTPKPLATAKGSAPRKWDCWYVVNNAPGSEAIRYLGNIRLPPVPGYGDTDTTEFTASKSNKTITISDGPPLPTDGSFIGYYFAWPDGTRDLIDDVPTSTTITTRSSGTVSSSVGGVIHPPINGTLYHKAAHYIVAHFGRRIYVSTQMPFAGWVEVVGLVADRPTNGPSSIFEFEKDAILFANNGIYFIYLSAPNTPYYWRMNTDTPVRRIEDAARTGSMEYKYRYTYTAVRFSTNDILLDRFNAADGCLLKKESGPVAVDENNVDYGERWTNDPIGPGTTTYGKLTGGALSGNYASHAGWMTIDDASWIVNVNNTTYECTADFTSVENMKDVARILQNAIRVHPKLARCTVEYDDSVFVLNTGEGETVSYATAGTTGTNVASALGWTQAAGATISTPCYTSPHLVKRLFLPPNSRDITHYGVYRTRDCSELSDNEHAFTWVADIPVCKAITASIDASGNMTVEIGELEKEDEGCILVSITGQRVLLKSSQKPNPTVLNADGSPYSKGTIAVTSWGIGGGTVLQASQSGTTLTVINGKTLSPEDEGKAVFWADRGYSIITKYLTETTALCAWGATHIAQAAHMDPIARDFTDIISDEDITKGRAASYPLQNRFWKPLPSGDIGLSIGAYLFCAQRGSQEYRYCSTSEKYLAGYHHPGFQVDHSIWDGIQSMRAVGGTGSVEPYVGVLVRGTQNTYFIKTDAGIDVGNEKIGETCVQVPSPRMITRSIGSIGDGGAQALDGHGEILITSEPAVRTHDGEKYSDINYAAGAVQNSELVKFKPSYVTAYQRRCGFFIWGKQET